MNAITGITVKAVTVLTGQVKGAPKENPQSLKWVQRKLRAATVKIKKATQKPPKRTPSVVVTVPQGANFEITIKSKGPQQKKVESGTRNQKGKGCAPNCKNAPKVKSNKK